MWFLRRAELERKAPVNIVCLGHANNRTGEVGIKVCRGTFFILEDGYQVARQETLGNGTKHLSQSHLLRKVQELGASICHGSVETALQRCLIPWHH